MARPSTLDLATVKEAIHTLQQRGEKPTWHRIRKFTGTGSRERILELMVMAGLDPDMEQGAESDPLLRRMAHLLKPVVLELNQEMEEERRALLSQTQERIEVEKEKISALQEKLETKTKALAAEEIRRRELEQLAEARREAIAELELAQAVEAEKTVQLGTRLTTSTAALTEAKRQQATLDTRLEHLRQAASERLAEVQAQHQTALDNKHKSLQQLIEEKGQLKSQLTGTLAEVQKLNEVLGRMSQDLTKARHQTQAATERNATQARHQVQLRDELDNLKKALAALHLEFAEAARASLLEQHRTLEEAISALQVQLEKVEQQNAEYEKRQAEDKQSCSEESAITVKTDKTNKAGK